MTTIAAGLSDRPSSVVTGGRLVAGAVYFPFPPWRPFEIPNGKVAFSHGMTPARGHRIEYDSATLLIPLFISPK